MHRKLRLCFILALVICAHMGWSQKSLIKAERQFELKAFELAIQNAKKALEKDPNCIDCHYIIAESFRMMNENVDAANWYQKMENLDGLPVDFAFNYGLLLKRMGEYEKAKTYFNNYKIADPEKGEIFANSCDFAIASLSSDREYELNLYAPSSKSTDFGPAIFRNQMIWCSFRTDFKRNLEIQNSSLIQDEKCQLFISEEGFSGDIDATSFLLPDEDETYDMGPIHYASDAAICAVTKNNFRDGEKQIFTNDLELSLFIATVNEDGSFTNLKAFPYNEAGYATGFGTLNPTGKILYFASNRPGGYGGFDLYVSYYKNNRWTYPDNLGPTINTEGNEITPYFDGETLYFSSDFRIGLGGYDVFSSFVNYGEWQGPINMENGVNSPEDDYYFIKHPHQESYYLTSNRLGGRGYHDIYLVHKGPEQEMVAEVEFTPQAVDLETDVIEDTNWAENTSFVNYNEEDNSIEEFDPAIVPEAVSLDELEDNEPAAEAIVTSSNSENDVFDTDAIIKELENIDFDNLHTTTAVDITEHMVSNVSLVGAKRVALGEIVDNSNNVYFIQLAALFTTQADVSLFSNLTRFGSLYKVEHTNSTKVKLGYFIDKNHAKSILSKVKAMGYGDAFITFESMSPAQMELVTLSDDTNISTANSGFVSDYTTGINYKVRLASYVDPIWFNIDKVNDLGIIEQWSKGEWTIFVLSGYRDEDEAYMARVKAINRGFRDAEIVIDRNGILEKLN